MEHNCVIEGYLYFVFIWGGFLSRAAVAAVCNQTLRRTAQLAGEDHCFNASLGVHVPQVAFMAASVSAKDVPVGSRSH